MQIDKTQSFAKTRVMAHENCDHSGHNHHGHSHGHSHGHHHHHATGRIGFAFWLNFSFAVLELFGGLYTNSIAIISDALHDFGDSLALGMAYVLEGKSVRASTTDYTYGYRRLSTLSALFTSGLLVAGSIAVVVTSVPRLWSPVEPNSQGMMLLAVVGLVVNGIAALRMSLGGSLNERAIFWHMMEDAVGWAVVLVGAILIYFFQWSWIDPLMAIVIAGWIGYNVSKTMRGAILVFLQKTPEHMDLAQIEMEIRQSHPVQEIHHTHVWTLDGEKHILTAHLVLSEAILSGDDFSKLKSEIKLRLKQKFNIVEATLEFELPQETCIDPKHTG